VATRLSGAMNPPEQARVTSPHANNTIKTGCLPHPFQVLAADLIFGTAFFPGFNDDSIFC